VPKLSKSAPDQQNNVIHVQCESEKHAILVLGITLANVGQFSKFFSGRHWHRGCAHSVRWHIVLLEDKELTTDLAHDSQCQGHN